MVLRILIPVIIILILVVLGLGIGIFFSKKKQFPEGSISKNKDMQKLKITCAKHDELRMCEKEGGCCCSEPEK